MNSASDNFAELETRILRTIELVKATRQERDRAQAELQTSRASIARLEKEVEQLRQERDLVRNKVESLLETLAEFAEETVV
jgi:septal ring factor EnvC (AmiA/AmiB activator)